MSDLSVRLIDDRERDYWDSNVKKLPNCHPLNAYGWSKIREIDSWHANYLIAEKNNRIIAGLPLLEKRIPFSGLCIFYAPRGPIWDSGYPEAIKAMMT